ncbi:phage major capsid, P2 family protein [Escherichia coli p0305293.4]|nr:phage major capsid, P2 family protein [Escherichia coli p0305293.4]
MGKGGDYASLDALVMDATNNLIEPWYQEDPDLVVIVGRQLLADKYFPIVNKEQDNSEMLAADVSSARNASEPAGSARPVLPGRCDAHHEAGKPVHLLHG